MSFTDQDLETINSFWRAANYLSVGQIYLMSNPLLRRRLEPSDIKPRLLGHWGTTPGLNFIYAHLNRIIRDRDTDMIFVTGPGHGGPALVACTYLEGTYSELYPGITRDEEGLQKLFKQFSFPGGIPSHTAPQTPGSINEGGELGYSLSHAYGAAFDNPGLVGDGEAETGPWATAWHSNKFLNPKSDGTVLPILHLNGYKIANPTILARIGREELTELLRGYGYEPYFVDGDDPAVVHRQMAETLDKVFDEIAAIRSGVSAAATAERPHWPMIVFKTPKGWTGPKVVDGLPTEGTWRSHQVPLAGVRDRPDHLKILEDWMRSYKAEELFDEAGTIRPGVVALVPEGDRRMGANPQANGGRDRHDLERPDFHDYAIAVTTPGAVEGESTRVLGYYLRDAMQLSAEERNFRVYGPDETNSNRLGALFDVTNRSWLGEHLDTDDHLAPDGRVMEILSEHTCQGWLEGYITTGRHGLFSTYEAFVHIVDSMFNQHAKWLEQSRRIPWRRPIPSLNYLLTSHVWRQDHNGASHQDPGFIDLVVNKKPEVVRVFLPADANTLLVTMDWCFQSRDLINVVVAGKQPEPQWLSIDEAIRHFDAGISIWDWASNDDDGDPDVVMASAGDVPTLETLAAISLLREHVPELKIRMINVIDLMCLQPHSEHPRGFEDAAFDALFTADKPIVFAYHGYPWLIHRLTYRRTNHHNLHVRGYKEEGTTTTPFDMVVLNDIDRFHLVMDVIDRVPGLAQKAAHVRQEMLAKLSDHHHYVVVEGEDMPEIRNWRWPAAEI
jgi:xylulose-5-phosphate/fructose-6-phosphate phosphoketolase